MELCLKITILAQSLWSQLLETYRVPYPSFMVCLHRIIWERLYPYQIIFLMFFDGGIQTVDLPSVELMHWPLDLDALLNYVFQSLTNTLSSLAFNTNEYFSLTKFENAKKFLNLQIGFGAEKKISLTCFSTKWND